MPPPLPPLSPISSDTWTSVTAFPALPPPPPPPVSSSAWDFWDPFVPPPPSSRSVTEEEWEATTTTGSEVVVTTTGAASMMALPSVVSEFSKETSSDLAMVVSRNTKDLIEVIKELDEYFLKAAEAGGQVSLLLEVPSSGFSNQSKGSKAYNSGWSLSPSLWAWGSSPKLNGFGDPFKAICSARRLSIGSFEPLNACNYTLEGAKTDS